MKLSAQGQLRLAAKLAFAAGASSLLGVAHAADATASPTQAIDSSSDSNLQLAQAEAGTPTGVTGGEAGGGPVSLKGIQVTGSRIKQPSLTSNAALQVVNDKEIKLEGTVHIETLLNNLPQVFSDQNNGVNNGATGAANVDLRGLGATRTLVLVDGKRVVSGSPESPATNGTSAADLNFIPAALVDRVEVLTGGASAVYGSDAIAGVVNFIMKKDFEGFTIDGQWGTTDHGDATNYTANLIWGTNFAGGGGNVTLYAGYTRFDALTEDARDFSKCAIGASASGKLGKVYDQAVCLGSYTTPNATIIQLNPYQYFQVDPAGSRTFVPFSSTFNYNPYNYLQRPDQRYTLGGFAHREFSEHLDVYGSAMFMTDRTLSQVAPSGTFFKDVVTLTCDNPMLSSQEQQYLGICGTGQPTSTDVVIGKRAVEFGPRVDDRTHTEYRILFGAKGSIDSVWSYDASVQRSETIFADHFMHDLSSQRFLDAINVVGTPGDPSTWQCASGNAGCAPFDIFATGQLTPAAIAYVQGEGLAQGRSTEQVSTASLTGDLGQYGIQIPLAKSGLQVAGGFEYRTEALDYSPDQEFHTGDLAGQGGPQQPIKAGFGVRDWFGEAQLPIVQDKFLVKDLELDAAYRLSNYDLQAAKFVHAYKLGFRFSPTEDVTLRGTWNRAVRAPNLQELFFPASVALFSGTDPCAGTNPTATAAECARTGVTPSQYGSIPQCSAKQCNQLIGGNPELQAERAITRQLGLVFTPRFLKGFSSTVDFYDIIIGNEIGVVPPTAILNDCINSGTFCSLIHRGPGGVIWGPNTAYVQATNINTGFVKQRGVDVVVDYNRYLRDLGLGNAGRVDLNFVGTYISTFSLKNTPTSEPYDCAGLYGLTCGNPNPRWRHKLRVTWDLPPSLVSGLEVSAQWRYIGSTLADVNASNSQLNPGGGFHDAIDAKTHIKQYLDLSLAYQLPLEKQDITVRFGVTNLNNEGPAVVTSNVGAGAFYSANTYPGVYDTLGRVFFLGATVHFQ
ncbi:MAG: TonB-dependent receptor [Sinobacteraceae bacterium]|nr:TonB-dependent receptor [Nevskiaceae bacterium]